MIDNGLAYLHETTHWLILISGFVLADSGEGEQPLVPDAMVQLSMTQASIYTCIDKVDTNRFMILDILLV